MRCLLFLSLAALCLSACESSPGTSRTTGTTAGGAVGSGTTGTGGGAANASGTIWDTNPGTSNSTWSASGGTDGTETGCVPNCVNKDCGSDGCGGSCGTCYSSEKCQQATCSAQNTCVTTPITEKPECVGVWLTQCYEGEFDALNCLEACDEGGGNFVTGCNIAGASKEKCNCYTVEEQCTQSYVQCDPGNAVSGCLGDKGMFYQATCNGVCRQVGLDQSVGCKPNWGCMCAVKDTQGNLCLPDGEPCDAAGINIGCCKGTSCTVSGSTAFCKKTQKCAPKCVHYETGLCCGGALCSGKCVGNPCCS